MTVLAGIGPELSSKHKRKIRRTSHTARCRTELNMEATEVSIYSFISKLMCCGSQQMCEQRIMRCVWMWRQKYYDVHGFTETFHSKFQDFRGLPLAASVSMSPQRSHSKTLIHRVT